MFFKFCFEIGTFPHNSSPAWREYVNFQSAAPNIMHTSFIDERISMCICVVCEYERTYTTPLINVKNTDCVHTPTVYTAPYQLQ